MFSQPLLNNGKTTITPAHVTHLRTPFCLKFAQHTLHQTDVRNLAEIELARLQFM